MKHGKQTEWYESGEKKREWNFVNGVFRGAWIEHNCENQESDQ